MSDEAPVRLTSLEMGMLLRIMVEKRERGAEEGDLFLYDASLAIVGDKLLSAMCTLEDPNAEPGKSFSELELPD
jgi:hypothetical protein